MADTRSTLVPLRKLEFLALYFAWVNYRPLDDELDDHQELGRILKPNLVDPKAHKDGEDWEVQPRKRLAERGIDVPEGFAVVLDLVKNDLKYLRRCVKWVGTERAQGKRGGDGWPSVYTDFDNDTDDGGVVTLKVALADAIENFSKRLKPKSESESDKPEATTA